MAEPLSMQNDADFPPVTPSSVRVHLVPWLVWLFFSLLVVGACISGLVWDPQGLSGWVLGWAGALVAWWGVSQRWVQSGALEGDGAVTCLAAVALFWAEPALVSMALLLWLSAGAMLLWGSSRQPPLPAWGVALALLHAVAALLMAALGDWPRSRAPAEIYQVGAAVMAMACHAALATMAWRYPHQQSRQRIRWLEQELARQKSSLQSVAAQDLLTGVDSLSQSMAFINQLRERNARKVEGFCVVLVELDPWISRRVEPVQNKAASLQEQVQFTLSGILTTQVRTVDKVGRHLQQAFILVLPDTTSVQAVWLLQRIRESMRFGQWGDVQTQASLTPSHPTLTMAVAEYQNGETAEGLLLRAELALQHGRAIGHDQIIIAEDLKY